MGYIENLNEIMSIKEQLKTNLGIQSNNFAMYPELIDKTVEEVALEYDMAKNYFTIEVLELSESNTGAFTLKMESGLSTTNLEYIAYSKNDSDFTIIMNETNNEVNTTISNLVVGDKIRLCGKGLSLDGFHITAFGYTNNYQNTSAKFKIYGNIMSLVNENNFENTELTVNYQFKKLFGEQYGDQLRSEGQLYVDQLVLPSNCTRGCYLYMFQGANIITPPQLPATTLAQDCYNGMFYKCGNLTYAPQLPATTLSKGCYYGMFTNCTSLTSLPYLSATSLQNEYYRSMFIGCTGITIVDCFPDDMSASYGNFRDMFNGCTNITYVKDLVFASISGDVTYLFWQMFYGCTRLVNGPIIYVKSFDNQYAISLGFSNCSNIKRYGVILVNLDDYSHVSLKCNNVSSYGTVIINPKANYSGQMQSGWNIGRYFRTDNRIYQYFDTYDDLLSSVNLTNGYINTESLSFTNNDYNALFDTSALLSTSIIKAQIYDNNTLTEQTLSYSASGEASVTVSLTAGQIVKLYAGTTLNNGEYWINAFSTADEGQSYKYTVASSGNYIITTHAGTNKPYFTVTAA